jgi:hypothetical protein
MEQNKHLEPNISDSFSELSQILLNNYKDNSSIGSSVYGGSSQYSGYYMNNNLAELVKRDASASSASEEGLTAQSLKNHNISLSNKRKYGEQGIQEVNEDDEDENDRKK